MNYPLLDKIILMTRAYKDSEAEFNLLKNKGAEIIPFPTIKILPVDDDSQIKSSLNKFNEMDYLLLTSRNACNYLKHFEKKFNVTINYSNIKVVATGIKTHKCCEENCIPVDMVPKIYSARGIIEMLSGTNLDGTKFFIPGSEIARNELKSELERQGAIVYQVPTYRVIPTPVKEITAELNKIDYKKPDIFIFTSPSTFYNYLKILDIKDPVDYFKNKYICAIGRTTERAIKKYELNLDLVPKVFTLETLINDLLNEFS